MSSINRHILWLLCAVMLVFTCPAGSLYAQTETDSYKERKFDPERLERYRNNPDYRYERAVPEPPKPPKEKERVKYNAPELTAPKMSSPNVNFAGIVKVLFWVLIIGAAVFLLVQLLNVRFKGLVKKKSDEAVDIEEVIDVEDIANMEFEDPIKTAIDAGQFRKAVRLLYLKSLRELQDRSMIQWKREKTNRQYLRELGNKQIRPLFQDITFIFEYIWYGEFPVDRDHFNTAYSTFLQFDQALKEQDAQ